MIISVASSAFVVVKMMMMMIENKLHRHTVVVYLGSLPNEGSNSDLPVGAKSWSKSKSEHKFKDSGS